MFPLHSLKRIRPSCSQAKVQLGFCSPELGLILIVLMFAIALSACLHHPDGNSRPGPGPRPRPGPTLPPSVGKQLVMLLLGRWACIVQALRMSWNCLKHRFGSQCLKFDRRFFNQ